MYKLNINNILFLLFLFVNTVTWQVQNGYAQTRSSASSDSLVYQFDDEGAFDYNPDKSPLYLERPSNINRKVEYDPETGEYVIYEKLGDIYYRLPKTMTLEEYIQYDFERSLEDYWKSKSDVVDMENQQSSLIPQITVNSEAFTQIFGSGTIDIKPQGYVEVGIGYESNFRDDDQLSERMKRVGSFVFDQSINMSVTGKIGEKVDMRFNYNTEATFDYENQINLNYTGTEDEILRKIEAGNVSLPLNGTLIQGGTNLFGVKTEMQFGNLNITTVLSQNKGESTTIETSGGSQTTEFSIKASEYDKNRHFFLSEYFRAQYDNALKNMPLVNSSVQINKIEVWVTNKTGDFTDAHDMVGFVDLGEPTMYNHNTVPDFQGGGGRVPNNDATNMYQSLKTTYAGVRDIGTVTATLNPLSTSYDFIGGKDWEKVEKARKLSSSEYTYHSQLGYISLNGALNADEVLCIAYQYTVGGQVYQVGEFSTDGIESGQTLLLKMLKGTSLSPSMPTWDLMMKNVYNLGAQGMTSENFQLNIVYQNDATNTTMNTLPETNLEGHILLSVMNLDNLNANGDPSPYGGPDGLFDYVSGVTVIESKGRIIFPTIEPFGQTLADSITTESLEDTYVFDKLYNSTQTQAQQDAEHDKYYLTGEYKGSSSSEISLNAWNLTQGSVKVTSGGVELTENIDYTVDYSLGRVKIINTALLESGTPISVSVETQDMFTMQQKTLLGTHANYTFSDNFNIGGTMLWMNEKPITSKVDYGEEPINNLMLGLDLQYNTQSQLLTDAVNLLPFYESDVKSSISVEGEVAKLYTFNSNETDNSIYIDDFEATESSYELRTPINWKLSSTPQGQNNLFPEGNIATPQLEYNFNRAKLAWYTVSSDLNLDGSNTPDHLSSDVDQRSNHLVRNVQIEEIFPGKDVVSGQGSTSQYVFNLAYYPNERGPYNYDDQDVNADGTLRNPEDRWAGITHEIYSTDFETANIEFIEFWMMDPFVYDSLGRHEGGDLYFNLGNISEDVLKDSRKSFEQGLPETELIVDVDTTVWGIVPSIQQLNESFATGDESIKYQDVGMDGLSNANERTFFADYLTKMKVILSDEEYAELEADPSGDDYHYYRGSDFDNDELSILERYKKYNLLEGNSQDLDSESINTVGTKYPDIEDVNGDKTMSEFEAYYQYKVRMHPDSLVVGQNHIVDKVTRLVESLPNGNSEYVDWYQFKIPIYSPAKTVGVIDDFSSIRFMRMFLTDFKDPLVMRFGTLQLVRSDWRKYTESLIEDDGVVETDETTIDVSTVNIEENSERDPINYVLPPGIERETDPTNVQTVEMNEQSMSIKVVDLQPKDSRAVYKTIGVDMRQYKRLKMEIHAEAIEGYLLDDDDVSIFVRLGSDFVDNYYEYEIPLKLTDPDVNYIDGVYADQLAVWPDENRIDESFDIFTDIKQSRNAEMRAAGSELELSDIYTLDHDADISATPRFISIKGSPTLGDVDVMMIGIRNNSSDIIDSKSVEVWVNEIRMSDLEQDGGWASNGRVSMRLADLGSVTVAGGTQSAGWGSIDQSASSRALEDSYEINVSTTVELGKLLPEKFGVKLPLFYGYSQYVSSPEYSPYNTDLTMDEAMSHLETSAERDSVLRQSQDRTTRKTLNISNAMIMPERKDPERKSRFYDIENFTASYNQSIEDHTDPTTAVEIEKNYSGALAYSYTSSPKVIEPLKKVKFLSSSYLQLIRDFNFYLSPQLVSLRTDMTRYYYETQALNLTNPDYLMPTTVQKDFTWNYDFDIRWNLTRSLKVDFSNQTTAFIDEPAGKFEKGTDEYEMMRDSVWQNIVNLGRTTEYHHTINATYSVPLNKIPGLRWLSSSLRYGGNYDWYAGTLYEDLDLGNQITNSMNASASGQANFQTLYNKVPYLKKVNSKYKSSSSRYGSSARRTSTKKEKVDPNAKMKEVDYSAKKLTFKADVPKSILHKLETKNITKVVLTTKNGKEIEGEFEIVDKNRINYTVSKNVRDARVEVIGQVPAGESMIKKTTDISVRFLMLVRNVRLVYNRSGSTILPGFIPEPNFFGVEQYQSTSQSSSSMAPTFPFIMGWQDEMFWKTATDNGWITSDSTQYNPYIYNQTTGWSYTSTLEPFKNVKIELSGMHQIADNLSQYIQLNETSGAFEAFSPSFTGNFSMSVWTISTAFESMGKSGVVESKAFNTFLKNRQIISQRLGSRREDVVGTYTSGQVGYNEGYGEYSVEVLIPAFLSAYTGTDPYKSTLSPFPEVTKSRPSWQLNYNGRVDQIQWLKKYLHSLNFSHAYKSSYSVGSFSTNLIRSSIGTDPSNDITFTDDVDESGNYLPEYDITGVTITEQFSPLINVDLGWKNDLTTRFEYSKSRTLNLSFSSNQLAEMVKNSFSFGVGYRITGLDMIIKTGKKNKTVSNDINLTFDLGTSKTKSTIRPLDPDEKAQLQSGSRIFTIDFTADYMLSDKLQIKSYYRTNINDPYTSTSIYTRQTEFGLSFQFSLIP